MPESQTGPQGRRRRPLMWLLLAVVAGAILYLYLSWETSPITGDPETLRAASEDLVSVPRRVLVVAAHPDDVEWYVGGTLLRMTSAGSQVTLIIATDGERGRGRDQHADLGAVRRAEAVEAGSRLGCAEVISLGLPDMRLLVNRHLQSMIREVWERVDPEVVFTFDSAYPRFPYVHPDHQAVGRATAAIYNSLTGARPELYLFHSRRPDTVVDITEVMRGKTFALSAHQTQRFSSREHPYISSRMSSGAGRHIDADYGEAYRKR